MKTLLLTTCALAALPYVSGQSENLVINGDFEAGKGTTFYSTPPWYNRGKGFNQGANARSHTDTVIAGSYSATINDRYDSAGSVFGPLAHSQNTGYIIKEGDVFSLSYDWRPVNEYWQINRDTVRFVLYATADDKPGGPVVWSSVHTSDFFKNSVRIAKSVMQTSSVVGSAAVGRKLIINFYGLDTVDGVNGNPHYARVDNIAVTVDRAPGQAPSSGFKP